MGRKTKELSKLECGQNSRSGEANEIDAILAERGKTHGDFKDQAWIAQGLKAMLESGPNWATMSADKKEALHMVAHKMSRIVCGDPEFDDGWIDISGYVTLIYRSLRKNKR